MGARPGFELNSSSRRKTGKRGAIWDLKKSSLGEFLGWTLVYCNLDLHRLFAVTHRRPPSTRQLRDVCSHRLFAVTHRRPSSARQPCDVCWHHFAYRHRRQPSTRQLCDVCSRCSLAVKHFRPSSTLQFLPSVTHR